MVERWRELDAGGESELSLGKNGAIFSAKREVKAGAVVRFKLPNEFGLELVKHPAGNHRHRNSSRRKAAARHRPVAGRLRAAGVRDNQVESADDLHAIIALRVR